MSFNAKPQKGSTRQLIPTEHDEQVMLCKWLDAKRIKYNATPNGGVRHVVVAKKLKDEGVKAGFPDLTIFLPKRIIYIELKRQKGSVTSKEQIEWVEYLNTLPYAEAHICKGAKEAQNIIEEKLEYFERN